MEAKEKDAVKQDTYEADELEADSRERIKRAVTAHENRIAELEALIAKGAESKAS